MSWVEPSYSRKYAQYCKEDMLDVSFHKCQISYQGLEFSISYFIRQGPAPALLYLHGVGASKDDFLGAASYQGLRNYCLVALDFPGCAGTPYPEDREWGVGDLVRITDQLTRALDLSDFVIVGHSLGGLVGLLYSHQHPGKVTAFVNIEGNMSSEDCFLTRPVARLSFSDFLGTQHLQNLRLKFRNAPDNATRAWAEALGPQVSPRAFYDYSVSTVDWSDKQDLLAMFSALPVPRLFIYGSVNSHLSYLARLRQSDAVVVEVSDSGHWPHLDNPEFFYRVVGQFLSSRTE